MLPVDLDLNGKSVLITGGTGSFGKKFTEVLLQNYPGLKRLVIFSRDELKQYEMSQIFSTTEHKCLRYFLGDVRDLPRLKRAFENIEIVIHTAALKQVPAAEYNPSEFIKTNIIGAENVIAASLETEVKNIVALSTDKAAAPINLYGTTKLASDKLFIAANNIRGQHDCKFSVVRYGNVMGSRGSVIPFFLKKRNEKVLPITHPDMTRFNITLEEGVNLVLFALQKSVGGEIFIPKIPSYKITDVAEAIGPGCKHEIIGIRPGEKLHEEMITENDSMNTFEMDKYYVIWPSNSLNYTKQDYIDLHKGKEVDFGFKYNSGTNSEWLSVEQLRELIRQKIDPSFTF